jgi:hypothetical protein
MNAQVIGGPCDGDVWTIGEEDADRDIKYPSGQHYALQVYAEVVHGHDKHIHAVYVWSGVAQTLVLKVLSGRVRT